MSTFDALLGMPAVPAVMAALIASPSGVEETSIVVAEGGPDALENALSALSRHGFIIRRSGRACLPPGSDALDKARRIVAVFGELRSFTEISLMVRGVLVATIAEMDEEGALALTREMLEGVLAAEKRRGYIEELDIVYNVRGNLREKFFPYIPRHHYEDFVFMHSRARQASPDGPGASVVNERYVLSRHPASLAEQARQYMREHSPHILERVRSGAFDIVWWFDRY